MSGDRERKLGNYVNWIFASLGAAASLVALVGLFSVSLPSISIHIDCDVGEQGIQPVVHDDPSTYGDQNGMQALHRTTQRIQQFANQNNGDLIHLSVDIESSAQSGFCLLQDRGAVLINDEGTWRFGIDSVEPHPCINDAARFSHEFTGRGEHLFPVTMTLFDVQLLPTNGLYRQLLDGKFYNVDGPFVIRSIFCGGITTVVFEPVDSSEQFYREVQCARRLQNFWYWLRPIIPCF